MSDSAGGVKLTSRIDQSAKNISLSITPENAYSGYSSLVSSSNISLDAKNGITLTGKTTVSGTLSNGVIKISEGYISVKSNTTMSYIDIRDLGTLRFYHSGSGSVTLTSGSQTSTDPYLEMDVFNSDSTGKTSVSIMTPQYGGLSFAGTFFKGTDGYSPYMFYPFCGRNLFLYLTKSSASGYYGGSTMSMGSSYSTRFNGRAVFLITPYYSSSSSSSPSGSIKITSGSQSSPTSETNLSERTGIVFGYLIIETTTYSPWITVSYLNSSGTWNTSDAVKSNGNSYYQVTCTKCILNRIA